MTATTGIEAAALSVRQLRVVLSTRRGPVAAVNGVDLDLMPGETHALVGESGSGKSVTALSIMRLLDGKHATVTGSVMFAERDLLRLPEKTLRGIRGREIAFIPQDPSMALNPSRRVGGQVAESLRAHGASRRAASAGALKVLADVGLYAPAEMARRYPFELSGGMQQRVAISAATMGEAKVLLADEPTTALDATIQQQVLTLLGEIVRRGAAMLLITHDLAVASQSASQISVMYGGIIVETGRTEDILTQPAHPYTMGLLGAIPRLRPPRLALNIIPGEAATWHPDDRGCPFRARCARAVERCSHECPSLETADRLLMGGGSTPHRVACWHPLDRETTGIANNTGTRREKT